MQLGDIEAVALTDGTNWGDGGGPFGLVPRVVWEKLVPCDEMNRVPMVLRCLLIRTPSATLLVETGMGNKMTPETAGNHPYRLERPQGWLLDSLAAQGIAPADIDIVLLTHLHADHSGGSTCFRDGKLVPTFPRAQYWVQEREWRDAHRPNERTRATYLGDNYDPLEKAGQLRLVDGETTVTRGIRLVPAPGHTAGLQVVVIESGDRTAVFLGDLAFYQWQIERLAWVSAYDLDPMAAIESKRVWQPWLVQREALIFFQHDPLVTSGRLISLEGRYKVEKVAAA